MADWVFLRHGQSVANAAGRVTGHADSPLTGLGRSQAAEAASVLADVPFQRAFSSHLSRAVETARIVLEGRGLTALQAPQLAERDVGEFGGRLLRELRDTQENELLLGWFTHPPGGESLADVALRSLPFLAGLPPVEGPTLVVAHGGLLRVVVGLLDGLPIEEGARWKLPNCEPMTRTLEPDTFSKLVAEHGPRLFPAGASHA
ncbi:MAG: histidine phosphatase family protein [Myxococcota bacterium]|nr:histidine phosphatase family protein [Myxococcota bacterium]